MKKILITGSTGFIGKEFIKLMRKMSNNDIYEVRRISGDTTKEFVGDLSDFDLIKKISNAKFDEIYHFAWQGLPLRNKEESDKNLIISKHFISALLEKSGGAQFNMLGSCLEYGDLIGSVSDETQPEGNDPFSSAKIELNDFMRNTGCQFRWFRPFYVYGLEQRKTSLIPHLIESFSSGNPVELKNYSNSHDFINVRDIAKAILLASKSDYFGPINIGTGVLTSVGEIVETFSENFQISAKIEYEISPGLFSESKILREKLTWQPEFSGIQGMLEYYFKKGNKYG